MSPNINFEFYVPTYGLTCRSVAKGPQIFDIIFQDTEHE